jgi:hypothetical protein
MASLDTFTILDLPGAPLTHAETYIAHDGPRTFALRSADPDIFYIVNDVDEDEEAGILFSLIVAVSARRLQEIRTGVIPFRLAFTEAQHGTLHLASTFYSAAPPGDETFLKPMSAAYLPESWLPAVGARLSMTVQPAV